MDSELHQRIDLDSSAQLEASMSDLLSCFVRLTLQWFAVYSYIHFFTVVIDSGSRYEVAYPSGISHFLEKLAFNVG